MPYFIIIIAKILITLLLNIAYYGACVIAALATNSLVEKVWAWSPRKKETIYLVFDDEEDELVLTTWLPTANLEEASGLIKRKLQDGIFPGGRYRIVGDDVEVSTFVDVYRAADEDEDEDEADCA